MIVLVESHRQQRPALRPGVAVPAAGARWGKAAELGFDRTDAEIENQDRGGINQVSRSQNRTSVKIWNLSPVWRAFDVVEIESSENPDLTIEATVTRQMLVPVGSEAQRYVGGGIGYVVDPGNYGFETRVIHTFVLLSLPSPVPDAPAVDSGEEGTWPSYPEERPTRPASSRRWRQCRGPGHDEMVRPCAALQARHGGDAAARPAGRAR